MTKIIIYCSFFIASWAINAQTNNAELKSVTSASTYEKGMQTALKLWKDGQSDEAIHLFEQVADQEPQRWLPLFYAAQVNVSRSFSEKDINKLRLQLDAAQKSIDRANEISKDNEDLLLLQAQWYTAWIVYDGAQYGMLYSQKASELYQKALAIAPNNPRVVLAVTDWNMGGARYFGESTESYCKDVHRAIELFATFNPKEAFYPTYGLERAEYLLKTECN